MISAPSGSVVTSSAMLACSAFLYSTTVGQANGDLSESTLAQAFAEIVAITRATRSGVKHLALNIMGALQVFQPLGGAASALGRAAKVENEQGDGERGEGIYRQVPRPWPGEDPDHQRAPHQLKPFFQSSTRAQTATAIPPSASAMNSQRRVSR